MSSTIPEYDYIIVGAGSAGNVLAARLTEDADIKVLLLEAGRPDHRLDFRTQMPAALAMPLQGTIYNWGYKTDPEPYMNDRVMDCGRGKGLGGSSLINGMCYIRGNALDFDDWAKIEGLEDWSYADCLPYFNMIALWKSLKEEGNKRKASTIGTANVLNSGKSWKARLQRIVSFPGHTQVEHFLQTIVLPAMTDVENELKAGGLNTVLIVRNPEHIGQDIDQGKGQDSVHIEGLKLQVGHSEQDDFIYEVNLVKAERPNFTLNTSSKLAEYYYRAEVFLSDGSQEYDLVGYTKEQVLVDILNQYERHMQYLHLER
ncbi:hypothetical protein H4W00_001388 [Psychrobacter sp. PL19]